MFGDEAAVGRHGGSAEGRGEEAQLGWWSARAYPGGEAHESAGVDATFIPRGAEAPTVISTFHEASLLRRQLGHR